MKSTFTNWIYSPLVVMIIVIAALAAVSYWFVILEPTADWLPILVFYIGFIVIAVWLVFGEMRLRMISVEITRESLIVIPFLGLGRKSVWYFNELDGYKTVMLPSRYDTYEYLFIMQEGKRVVRISAFYHRNYQELKQTISRRLKNKGQEEFSFLAELKDIFG